MFLYISCALIMPNNRWFHTARKESPQYCATEISEINFQDFTADGTVVPILIQHLFGLYQGWVSSLSRHKLFRRICHQSNGRNTKLVKLLWLDFVLIPHHNHIFAFLNEFFGNYCKLKLLDL